MQHRHDLDLVSKPVKPIPQRKDEKPSQEDIFGCLPPGVCTELRGTIWIVRILGDDISDEDTM